MPKKHRLRKLKIKEISLVDEPANPGASVLFYKRKGGHEGGDNQETDTMTLEELAKALETANEKAEKHEAEMAEVTKRAEAAEAEVAELKKKLDAEGAGEEDIYKGMSKAAVAHFKKMEAENKASREAVAKMADERREAEFIKQAEGYANLPVKPEEFGPVLKRFADGEAKDGDMDMLGTVLKAADAAFTKATQIRGDNPTPGALVEGSAEQKLDALAKARVAKTKEEGGSISYVKAYNAVLSENPDLYNQSLTEAN